MLDRVSLKQFNEWRQYERQAGPFNEFRSDWRIAHLCALIAAANGAKDVNYEDFIWKSPAEAEEAIEFQKELKLARLHCYAVQNSAEHRQKRAASKR